MCDEYTLSRDEIERGRDDDGHRLCAECLRGVPEHSAVAEVYVIGYDERDERAMRRYVCKDHLLCYGGVEWRITSEIKLNNKGDL